jgi:hypothetical protein
MSFISIPQLTNLSKIPSVEKISSSLPGIAVGDLLEATILKNFGSEKYLIRINGSEAVQAESALPLRIGDTLKLRVDQLRPYLMLVLADQNSLEGEPISESLRLQRSNPGALLEFISNLSDVINSKELNRFLPYLNQENIKNLLRILDSLALSPKADRNQFFKEYIDNLGLQWENNLGDALKKGGVDQEKAGLKGALMKLSEELYGMTRHDGEARNRLDVLQMILTGSVKTLESEQIINVLNQENENRYLFQVPLFFPSGTRMSDILIEIAGKGQRKEGQEDFRILFLLNMDAIGDISVQIGIRGWVLNCQILCTNRDSCGFIASSLQRLEDGLAGLGFKIGSMKCNFENDLAEEREIFNSARMMNEFEAVNIFV